MFLVFKQIKIEPECKILILYTKPNLQTSQKPFLSPKKAQKIPNRKICDTSQKFPRGHTEYLAWSECL